MSNENINLNIGTQSISYVIDKELDKKLNQDVTLNSAQWNSIFGILKEEHAEITTTNDNGTSNKILKLTQSAWEKILSIGRNALNNTTYTEDASEDNFNTYAENGEQGDIPQAISVDNSSIANLKADLLKKSSYIMNYDLNDDGKLQYDEYLEMEMASDNLQNIDGDEDNYTNCFNRLDINKDGGIDNAEMASYYATMATINDTSKTGGTWNNITYEEWFETQTRLSGSAILKNYLNEDTYIEFERISAKRGYPTPEELFPVNDKNNAEAREMYTKWYNNSKILSQRMWKYYDTVFKES